MNELEKALEKYFLELPANVQQAVREVDWKQTSNKIGLANNLTPEQLISLEAETLMVLYGIEEAGNYVSNLTTELGIEPDRAQTISHDITRDIFQVIENKAKELESKLKSEAPVIITPETKKAVIAELSQRVEAARQSGATVKPPKPQPAPEIHPMIKSGEVARPASPESTQGQVEAPHPEERSPSPQAPVPATEPQPAAVAPASPEPTLQNPTPAPPTLIPSTRIQKPAANSNSRYPGGLDPYREPLE